MNAVERRDAFVLEVLSNGLVSRQHELLDQAMSNVALGAHDAAHQAELVKFNYRLGQVEVDGSAALALTVENHRQLAHQLEHIHQFRVTLSEADIALQDKIYVGVGHALG